MVVVYESDKGVNKNCKIWGLKTWNTELMTWGGPHKMICGQLPLESRKTFQISLPKSRLLATLFHCPLHWLCLCGLLSSQPSAPGFPSSETHKLQGCNHIFLVLPSFSLKIGRRKRNNTVFSTSCKPLSKYSHLINQKLVSGCCWW